MSNITFNPAFINDTVTSGVMKGLADNVVGGGDVFGALIMVVAIIMFVTVALKLPLEASAVLILPLLIVSYAFYPAFMSILGVFLIYLGIIVGKYFFLNN